MVQVSCNLSCSDISINTGGDVYVNGTVDDEVQLKRGGASEMSHNNWHVMAGFHKSKRINL